MQLRRLRHKLHEYYKTQGGSDSIRIEIPKGTYVPIIVHHNVDEQAPVGPVRRRLAVLPFVVLSPNNSAKTFAKILTKMLIDDFALSAGLEVVSRISSQVFDDRYRDRRRISKCLDADAILEGGVQNSDSRLKTTIRLASTQKEVTLWSSQFDTDAHDMLSTAQEISKTVAPVIESHLIQKYPLDKHLS